LVAPRVSSPRRLAFRALAAFLVVLFGFIFFGLTSLVIGWFGDLEGVAGPVTEIGYGALVGLILTVGLASQLRHPARQVAGLQQATLVIPALVAGSVLAMDSQNAEQLILLVPALGVLWLLHPARGQLLRPPIQISPVLALLALLGAIPLMAYALAMGAAAQELTGLLAAFRTPGWRIPAWSAALALGVFGVASVLFPRHPASLGTAWGGLAIAGGILFAAAGEWEARRPMAEHDNNRA